MSISLKCCQGIITKWKMFHNIFRNSYQLTFHKRQPAIALAIKILIPWSKQFLEIFCIWSRFETEILKYLKKGERQKNPFISGNFGIWSFSGFFSFLFSVIPLHEPYSSCCVLLQNGQRFEIEASQAPKGKLVKDKHHEK